MSNNYKSTLQSNNTELSSNNLDLQSLIDQANALPDAGGVELPELINEGIAADLLSGKELIDGDGNKVTGTFSIDSELNTQDDLIAQIQFVVDSLPEAGGGGSIETVTGTVGTSGPPIPGRPLSGTVHYVNANGAYATSSIIGTIIVMKDSILYASSGDGVSASGDLVNLSNPGDSKAYRVIGDFTINI